MVESSGPFDITIETRLSDQFTSVIHQHLNYFLTQVTELVTHETAADLS